MDLYLSFWSFQVYLQTVDLHAVRRNQQTAPAVDDPLLHQKTALRGQRDGRLADLDLKLPAVNQVCRVQDAVRTNGICPSLAERRDPLLRHRTVGEDRLHLTLRHLQGLRVPGLPVLDNLLPQASVDRLHHRHAARLIQRVGENGSKGVFLLRGGHGCLRMKHRVDERLVDKVRLLGVEQGIIEIRSPIVKSREQESQLR